jgi:PAS domain S-box-containing protein
VTVARRLEQDKRHQESHAAQLSDRLSVSEAELQDSATTLTLAADAASLGFWTRDLARDCFWASPHWRTLFGFSASEPVDGDAVLQRVHADDRACVARGFGLAPGAQGGNETVFRVELGGGKVRWVSSHGRVEFGAVGKPLAIRGVSLDITAQKQAELDIAQKRKEVTYLARVAMLGELSGAMAHELNQPLTSILINAGAAHLFLAQRADPELDVLRDIMQDIMEEDRRAGDIIKRLRGLFGKDEIVRHALAVNDLVSDVARVLRNDLINHSVTLRMELTQDLPPVLADRVQLQQVLINLVLNACDAMDGMAPPEREVTVRTARCDDGAVQVTVADQGTGIQPGGLEKIFESFYTTKERGMGLGLSICRNIVSANGGRLWAENHAGPGASFHFNLPSHATQS